MEKVHIDQALPGMVLAKTIMAVGSGGKELINKGVTLDRKHILKLQEWGVEFVEIQTPEMEADDGVFIKPVRLFAQQTYRDAVDSLEKLSVNLLNNENGQIHQFSASVRSVIEVIALEPDIMQLLSAAKQESEYLYRHGVDVCIISLLLGNYLKLPSTELHMLGEAALLHDIGLSIEHSHEWDLCHQRVPPPSLRDHPTRSYEIARSISGISEVTLAAILEHHEQVDGSGYPQGLRDEDTAVLAGILAVAEVYSTCISPFYLENSMLPYHAVEYIMNPEWIRFNSQALRAFIGQIAIFPVGSYICLDDGSKGIVVGNNKDKPLRPKALLLYTENSKPLDKPEKVDLSLAKFKHLHVDGIVEEKALDEMIRRIVKA